MKLFDITSSHPFLGQNLLEVRRLLEILDLPSRSVDMQMEVSFGHAMVLWGYGAMRTRVVLPPPACDTFFSLFGEAICEQADDDVAPHLDAPPGTQHAIVAAIADRRYLSCAGLGVFDKGEMYDLLQLDWVQGRPPAYIEGVSYNLTVLAVSLWRDHLAHQQADGAPAQ